MKRTSSNSYRSGVWRQHIISIFVWVCAVAGVVGLFHKRAERFEVLGLAQGRVHQIAATCDGRLTSLPVRLFERVNQGQTLAVIDTVLDNENLEAEMATISAQIQQLQAELAATQAQLTAEAANQQSDMIEAKRRFEIDVENTRLRVLELKTMIETDRMLYMQLANLNSDNKISILQNTSDPNAQYDLHQLQRTVAEDDVLAKKIKENKRLLVQAEEDLAQVVQRRDEFAQQQPQHPPVDSALEVIRRAIKVQELLVEGLLTRRTPLVLKSPIDGVVIPILGNANEVALRRPGENILRRPGEVISAGDPIFAVAEIEPREIVAYVEERQLARVREGMVVEIVKSAEPAQIARSQITYVSPVVEQMPERLWRNPNIPQWGRALLIGIHPDLKLVSGEIVGVKLL